MTPGQRRQLKTTMLREQNGLCAYCDEKMNERHLMREPTFDHVVPLSAGGKDSAHNLVLACRQCNQAKGSMSPDEMRRVADRIEYLIRALTGKEVA